MDRRNRHLAGTLAVIMGLLVLVPGCIKIKRPLSDPMTAGVDESLCGIWRSVDDPNTILTIGISELKKNPLMMKAIFVEYSQGMRKINRDHEVHFSLTKIGNDRYVNVYSSGLLYARIEFEGGYDVWLKDPDSDVELGKYVLNGDRLAVWIGTDTDYGDGIMSAARKRGEVDPKNPTSVVNYLRTNGDKVFPAARSREFVRISK